MQPNNPPSLRSPWAVASLFAVIAAAVYFVPYLVPVHEPTNSLSYLAGYSNRTAVVLLVLGSLGFAFYTKGEVARVEEGESKLSVRSLIISLFAFGLLCIGRRYVSVHHFPGGEAQFFLDRQQLLASGEKLYRQIDFMYGPILLYPGYLLAKMTGISQVSGYYLWWMAQWLMGVAMIWLFCRFVDIGKSRRLTLYLFLLIPQISALKEEGSNYTPVRLFCASILVLGVMYVWKRTRNPIRVAFVTIGASALGLAVSPEQGLAVLLGMGAYLVLQAWLNRKGNSWIALGILFSGGIVVLWIAARAGLFISLRDFASGGLAFPILASPRTLIILFVYVMAACVLYRKIFLGTIDTATIPLVVAGCVILPSAMGRCDMGHMMSAMPAFAVGSAAILERPTLRRIWFPFALALLLIIPVIGIYWVSIMKRVHQFSVTASSRPPGSAVATNTVPPPENALIGAADLPCDRQYFSPSFVPSPIPQRLLKCLDNGFYLGTQDVLTSRAILRKREELVQRPTVPLILQNGPIEDNFVLETDLRALRATELSPYAPLAKNPPLSYEPLISYLRGHYTPGPVIANGRLRIYYPGG
jgi:hypothetical protein